MVAVESLHVIKVDTGPNMRILGPCDDGRDLPGMGVWACTRWRPHLDGGKATHLLLNVKP